MVIDFRQRKVKIKLVWKILNQGKIWTTTYYTCKNTVTKPNLDEFLCKLFENIALKIVANNMKYVWQLTDFSSFCQYFLFLL